MASTFQYPLIVSRTLDPSGKSLRTIVALHDHEISDADINVIQDLQDSKRAAVLNDMVASGCLTYSPLVFNIQNPLVFTIPAFDVLFNGTVVPIVGNQSSNLSQNRVQIPAPSNWAPGTAEEPARLYVVFLELWYQSLNPVTGQGYFQDPITKLFYFYPYGGIQPSPNNAEILPDDSIDVTAGLFTTERAQIQWRINVQRVGLNYNFSTFKFGLDPDTNDAPSFQNIFNAVYAQASLRSPAPGISPLQGLLPYQFSYMGGNPNIQPWRGGASYVDGNVVLYNGAYYVAYVTVPVGVAPLDPSTGRINNAYWNPYPINGDTGLWVAGDGNVNNSLGTMDGYSYAMPLAVVFQRNTGNFDVVQNLFGCAAASVPGSGTTFTGISGRFDSELADQIFPADVVDTRSTVRLQGDDLDSDMRFGFGDLVTGNTKLAISRGLSPGNDPRALGSTLEYNVAIAPASIANTNTVGQWDGFQNGFSSDARTYFTTIAVPISAKTSGNTTAAWTLNDTFAIALPTTSAGKITSVDVTAIVSNNVLNTRTPASLLQGQFEPSNLGTSQISVQFVVNLGNTAFDPGTNPLYVTVGVTYPAGTGTDLRVIPFSVDGGTLSDNASGIVYPVFGVSEYVVDTTQIALPTSTIVNGHRASVNSLLAISPEYSDIQFGTRLWLAVSGAAGVQETVGGQTSTVFVIPTNKVSGSLNALYCVKAFDFATKAFYTISGQTMGTTISTNTQTVVTIQAAVSANSTVIFELLLANTCQANFNAPVKGITEIEETVLFGNWSGDANFPMDPRVSVLNVRAPGGVGTATTIVLGFQNCVFKGLSGDDTNRFIWVVNNSTNPPSAQEVQVQSINPINGTLTIVVPGTVTLDPLLAGAQPFFFVGSILPSLTPASSLIVSEQYIPYQGEGVLNRVYEIIHTEDNALITSNGTGAAPVVGLADVYPYNRELPIITMLPALLNWNDAQLTNTPLQSFFDSNFVAMQFDNVEDTFLAPLHTNDFIPPINKDTRKTIQFTQTAQRGFGQAIPHIGFAIQPPTARTVLGQNLQTTVAPITLYVNNSTGSDNNSGLSLTESLATLGKAISLFPPVLTFPCVVICADTGIPYSLTTTPNINVVALGDGDIRSSKIYCIANLSRVIQGEGRLVISQTSGATNPVVIDATGFPGFGDGPTCAFYMDTSRVILNGIGFKGFNNPALVAYNGDIDMVGCQWVNNVQAGSFVGCDSVILDGGLLNVPDAGAGIVAAQSNVTSSNVALTAGGTLHQPGAFYSVSRNSTLSLEAHAPSSETNLAASQIVAVAQLNSSIFVTPDFQSGGIAVLQSNSVLSRTVSVTPFLGTPPTGGVSADASSNITTQVG
jgi:hypothetical protein